MQTDITTEAATPTAAEIAYRELRRLIMTGSLAPGEHLPEKPLAMRLGVSRTPIRDALSRLHNQGLVVLEDYKRAYVAQFTEQDYQETLRMRSALEAQAAARAAVRATDTDIAELEALATEMEQGLAKQGPVAIIERYDELNSLFHLKIAQMADSPRLVIVLQNSIEVPPFLSTVYSEPQPHRIQRSMWQHREIIDAIKLGNSEWASHQMAAHLLSVMLVERPRTNPGAAEEGNVPKRRRSRKKQG